MKEGCLGGCGWGKMMIDIVIPVLNEEKLLREKEEYYLWLKSRARVIFADGESSDQTQKIARNYGEVFSSGRGRAHQMNAGAKVCRGDIILFLHADTFVSKEALEEMEKILSNGVCGGCFSMKIMELGLIFRVFERLVNFRARHLKILDGDLGLFVKRDIFNCLGGFDQVLAMEDILFSKKLRKAGRIVPLSGKILVSGRRWQEKGFRKTLYKYSQAYFQLWLGALRTNRW